MADETLAQVLGLSEEQQYTQGDERRNRNGAFNDVKEAIDYSKRINELVDELNKTKKEIQGISTAQNEISKLKNELANALNQIQVLKNDQSGLIRKDLQRDYSEEMNRIKNSDVYKNYLTGDTDENKVTAILGEEADKNNRILLPDEVLAIRNFHKVVKENKDLKDKLTQIQTEAGVYDTPLAGKSASLIKNSGLNLANVRGSSEQRIEEFSKL